MPSVAGAFDYLTKPLDLDQLRSVIDRALDGAAGGFATSRDSRGRRKGPPVVSLVGETPAMHDVYKMIGRLATNDVAGADHRRARHGQAARRRDDPRQQRAARSAVALARLHLHAGGRGRGRAVRRDAAGTVHLANVHALPPVLQATPGARSRAARSGARGALGRRRRRACDRLHRRDLTQHVAAGTFNHELYDALAVVTLRLPPLRERRDDIPLLVQALRPALQRRAESRRFKGVDDELARRSRSIRGRATSASSSA